MESKEGQITTTLDENGQSVTIGAPSMKGGGGMPIEPEEPAKA